MELIDKAVVMAEIENLVDKGKYHEDFDCAYRDGNNGALYALKDKLDSLEVKLFPVWSDEDERFFKTALWHLSHSNSNGVSTDIHSDTTDWLKSLRQRMEGETK